MPVRNERWPAGTPCWVDLGTPDVEASQTFYGAVLGWEFGDTGEDFGHYLVARRDGSTVAGMMTPPGADETPAAWTTYLASDAINATAEAITAAGGSVLYPPMQVGPLGWMLIAQDDQGVLFGAWQADQMIGMQLTNDPGSVGWNQCMTKDPGAAQAFYAKVFGYRYTPLEGETDYATIDGAGPGNTVGGMGSRGADAAAGQSPGWDTYFTVSDADAVVTAIEQRGGRIVSGPDPTPFGRMLDAVDPHGAAFSLAEVT